MKKLRDCFGIFFLAGLFPLAANALPAAPPQKSNWVAENSSIQLSVDPSTGLIDHLVDQVSHEDYCNQSLKDATSDTDGNRGLPFTVGPRIGGLLLWDELQNQVFSDLANPGTVTNWQASKDGAGQRLSFDKQYPGAQFVVHETFVVGPKGLRWDVRLHKTSGPDRTVRVIYNLPLPLGGQAWAPIAEAPFTVKPWLPFSIDYGQSTSGAVGEGEWRTTVPLMVFYSKRTDRALAIASPLEVPAVRIRFLSNTSALADFYWNSRKYPASERPYFQVSNEDLGLRTSRDLQTSLLISAQPANWRPALGWFYSQYKSYFDPSPNFAKWDGVYALGDPLMDPSLSTAQVKAMYAREYARGVRWEELHTPYPHYGEMAPPPGVESWVDTSDPGGPPLTRAKIEQHCKLSREAGVGTFLYYNTTESEYWYAQQNFPQSIARSEEDKSIDAWRGNEYPSKRACWLMNSDPAAKFGQQMIAEAKEMVRSYPDAAGFFWDVYGRNYMFDFAHDDGITMVDNRPAYYPEFMFERMMSQNIGPLLHDRGMSITANKPVTVTASRGVDGIIVSEAAPEEISPGWMTAQSYLGLTRHLAMLEADGANAELMYLECLRYGIFNYMVPDTAERKTLYIWSGTDTKPGKPMSAAQIAHSREVERKYQPYVNMFAGKRWIFYPHALDLPPKTYGNIFQLKNGDVMVTMVSAWRTLNHAEGYDTNLPVVVRLSNTAAVQSVEVNSIDLGETTKIVPHRNGNQLTITVPRHGKATVILLHMKG